MGRQEGIKKGPQDALKFERFNHTSDMVSFENIDISGYHIPCGSLHLDVRLICFGC